MDTRPEATGVTVYLPEMTVALRVIAAILIVAAGVVFFATEQTKAFAGLLVIGNLLSLSAHFVERRSER